MKTVEYVPLTMPTSIAKANPCRTSPPNRNSARTARNVVPAVMIVRPRVWLTAALTTCLQRGAGRRAKVLADAIERHDGVVHGVAGDREDRGHDVERQIVARQREKRHRHQDVVKRGGDGARGKARAEPDRDIRRDTDDGGQRRVRALAPQVRTDRGAHCLDAGHVECGNARRLKRGDHPAGFLRERSRLPPRPRAAGAGSASRCPPPRRTAGRFPHRGSRSARLLRAPAGRISRSRWSRRKSRCRVGRRRGPESRRPPSESRPPRAPARASATGGSRSPAFEGAGANVSMRRRAARPRDRTASKIVRETKTAVNTLASRPNVSVVAKPRIGPVPN